MTREPSPRLARVLQGGSEMRNEEKEPSTEEEVCKPLTDEEFKEYQEKDTRTTKKVMGVFSAVWDAITTFFN